MKCFDQHDWQEMARWMQSNGYAMTKLVSSSGALTDIMGAIFTLPGNPTNPDSMYLVYPLLKEYTVVYVDKPRPMDVDENIVYLPEYTRDYNRRSYYWVPRLVTDKPQLFTIRTAGEHVGLSAQAIKAGIYKDPGVRLKTDGKFGNQVVLRENDILSWIAQRRDRRFSNPEKSAVRVQQMTRQPEMTRQPA